MSGLLEQLQQGIYGALDSGAQWGRGVQGRIADPIGTIGRHLNPEELATSFAPMGLGTIFNKAGLLGIIPKPAIDKVEAWGASGGRLTYPDISELVKGTSLSDLQRQHLKEQMSPKYIESYERRINRAKDEGDLEKAARWQENYDAQLMSGRLFDEAYRTRNLNLGGPPHPTATTLGSALQGIHDLAARIRAQSAKQREADRLSKFTLIKGGEE